MQDTVDPAAAPPRTPGADHRGHAAAVCALYRFKREPAADVHIPMRSGSTRPYTLPARRRRCRCRPVTGDGVEPHTLPAGVPCAHARRSSLAAHENFRRRWYVLRDSVAGSVPGIPA